MKLGPHETLLECEWILDGKWLVADATRERIYALVRGHLKELAATDEGWSTLYSDPSDNRLWELDYPFSERHGGGPPRLKFITDPQALERYGPVALKKSQ